MEILDILKGIILKLDKESFLKVCELIYDLIIKKEKDGKD